MVKVPFMDRISALVKKPSEKAIRGPQLKRALYAATFETETGRRVLEDLAVFAALDSTIFDSDPLKMARNEGRRQVVLHILTTLKVDITELGGTYEYATDPDDGRDDS